MRACAGVAFTADPVSGRRDQHRRLGHRRASATAWSAARRTARPIVIDKATGSRSVEQPAEPRAQRRRSRGAARSGAAARGARSAGRRTSNGRSRASGCSCCRRGRSRPHLRAAPIADDHLLVFDNSNIVESYPGLVSPLTYSFAQYAYARVYRAFVRIVGVPEATIRENAAVFDNMLARIDGRVYYNLGNWYRALALLPGFSINRAYMETMMGVSQPLPAELGQGIGPAPAHGLALWREWLRVGRVGLRLALAGAAPRAHGRGFLSPPERCAGRAGRRHSTPCR